MDPLDCMELLDQLEEHESRLTGWEREFVDSLQQQLSRGRAPTIKQADTVQRLKDKYL